MCIGRCQRPSQPSNDPDVGLRPRDPRRGRKRERPRPDAEVAFGAMAIPPYRPHFAGNSLYRERLKPGFWGFALHSQRPDFCSWQQVRKRINSRLRTCWRLLARPCLHSKMLKRQEKVPFRTTVRLARKEENPSSRWNRAGAVGLTGDLDPVRDCRRPRRTQVFQRLNRMACIDG